MRARSPEFPILDVMIALRVRRRWPVIRGKETGRVLTLAPGEGRAICSCIIPPETRERRAALWSGARRSADSTRRELENSTDRLNHTRSIYRSSETTMDSYHIALFIHISTLVVAAGATAVTKLAVSRRMRARTVHEVLDWHNVMMSAAKLFPMCLAAFFITGAYMLSVTHQNVWSTGFVVAGLVGVALLLASGVILGTKGRALKQMLEGMAKTAGDHPAPRLVPPPLIAMLPAVNTGIAMGVVFDMVTKPASVPLALGIIVIGIVLGAMMGMRRPEGAREQVRA